jgi:hypothetical protein
LHRTRNLLSVFDATDLGANFLSDCHIVPLSYPALVSP